MVLSCNCWYSRSDFNILLFIATPSQQWHGIVVVMVQQVCQTEFFEVQRRPAQPYITCSHRNIGTTRTHYVHCSVQVPGLWTETSQPTEVLWNTGESRLYAMNLTNIGLHKRFRESSSVGASVRLVPHVACVASTEACTTEALKHAQQLNSGSRGDATHHDNQFVFIGVH